MENINKKTVDILNNLLEINNDRIAGYNQASKETNEIDLKSLFAQFAGTSYENKQELASEIRKLGGTPIEGTRTTGKLYRAWMDIRAALTNKDRKAILKSCETGEDVAVHNYEDALKEASLESSVYSLISKQYATIKSEHDKVRNMRDVLVEK